MKTVQQLCAEAKKLANTGEETKALKVYEKAIAVAGLDIGRINVKIRTSRAHEATRESIQGRLKEDLRRVGILIGKLRTKMAILHERIGEFDHAKSCCKEAMEVYKHQPVINEEAERDKVIDLIKLAENLFENLELSSQALIGRDKLLAQIEQLRREIHRTPVVSEKKKLYQKVDEVANMVISMEIKALGENHAQVADTLQLLSTIALEQNKHRDAVDFLENAIKISKSCLGMMHPRTGQYYFRLARIHLSQGDELRALDCFSKGSDFLSYSKRLSRVLGSTYNDVAVIHMRRREFDAAEKNLLDALHFYGRSLKMADSDITDSKHGGQSIDALQVHRNLGDCYMKKMDFEKASDAFLLLLKLQRDGRKVYDKVRGMDLGIVGVDRLLVTLIDDDSIADTLMRLGRAFAAGEKHHEALSFLREAADLLNCIAIDEELSFDGHIIKDRGAKKHTLSNTLFCVAEESCIVGDFDGAILAYRESMRLRCRFAGNVDSEDALSSSLHCTLCFIGIGNVSVEREHFCKAHELFSSTLKYCNRNNLTNHPVTMLVKQRIQDVENILEDDFLGLPELENQAIHETGKEKYDLALTSLTRALELRKTKLALLSAQGADTTEQVSAIARLLRLFGSVFGRTGDRENAMRAYSDASKLFKNCGAYEKISI